MPILPYLVLRCTGLFVASPESLPTFLLISMSTALIPLFIGDYVLQSRKLNEIPFQIPEGHSIILGKRMVK
jgi:hypothetical protein